MINAEDGFAVWMDILCQSISRESNQDFCTVSWTFVEV